MTKERVLAIIRRYSVAADSVEDFLEMYTGPWCKRALAKDGRRARARIRDAHKDIAAQGYTLIASHESITGKLVSYSPEWCGKEA
jgi:hypothetical protein